ncbi:FtsH protease activity modulator HflK [Pelagibacteraceae bacterium]|jgi:membrane protease subunit HflK|nr:FtsH protease activity modulator HflK [Pelagibacteraceae bacterium]MDB9743493.1 FtsH protease activity modulator HflK [Pelagibacteraceae bacterium]MDC0366306.1 FtsH protease activity modulator HflK [Pelagibacteraceae bacterium]
MSFKDKIFKNQSPWGAPPSGGSGSNNGDGSGTRQQPPSLDDIIKNLQKTFNRFSGGKSGGSKPIITGLIIVLGLYIASGLYRVLPDEQGVVLRFGKFVNMTQPGLHYHLPSPFERVLTPKVTKVNRVDVGFRPASDTGRSTGVGNVPEESLMLTGDENIVDINYSVFWVIKDAGKFLFNIQSPVETVKATSETAMREVIAKNNIQTILTEGRASIEIEVQDITQKILDEYGSGIQITQVQTQQADPPAQVIDAFRDVQAARADRERSKNEAEGYANDVIPRARGEAEQVLQQAEAYKKEVVAKAEGEASRFLAIYNEYKNAKQVTQERMYLETMEKVLADIDKVIIDKNASSGVVPYLPLPELKKKDPK